MSVHWRHTGSEAGHASPVRRRLRFAGTVAVLCLLLFLSTSAILREKRVIREIQRLQAAEERLQLWADVAVDSALLIAEWQIRLVSDVVGDTCEAPCRLSIELIQICRRVAAAASQTECGARL